MNTFARNRLSWFWLAIWFIPASAMFFYGNIPHELSRVLATPSFTLPFGGDAFGRDLFGLTLRSSVASLAIALLSAGTSFVVGILAGTSAVLAPLPVRIPIRRTIEFLLAFPGILLGLGLAALRGPGWTTLFISLILGSLPGFTRLIWVRTEELLAEGYIEAARAVGATGRELFKNHLLDALLSFASVKIPNLLAQTLMAEAALSFLGVGAPMGQDSWGLLLAQGKEYLLEAPHIALASGLPLFLTIAALQKISEAFFQSIPANHRVK